jgi:hypothetical protein
MHVASASTGRWSAEFIALPRHQTSPSRVTAVQLIVRCRPVSMWRMTRGWQWSGPVRLWCSRPCWWLLSHWPRRWLARTKPVADGAAGGGRCYTAWLFVQWRLCRFLCFTSTLNSWFSLDFVSLIEVTDLKLSATGFVCYFSQQCLICKVNGRITLVLFSFIIVWCLICKAHSATLDSFLLTPLKIQSLILMQVPPIGFLLGNQLSVIPGWTSRDCSTLNQLAYV